MTFSTIDISFPEDLLVQINQIADNEARTRDILVSDAVRMYIERKNEWQGYFNIGREIGSKLEISENDIMNEIETYRQEKSNQKRQLGILKKKMTVEFAEDFKITDDELIC